MNRCIEVEVDVEKPEEDPWKEEACQVVLDYILKPMNLE